MSQAILSMNQNIGCDDKDFTLLEYVKKATPPPFLLKTYMLVEDPITDEIISWNGDGTSFVVWQMAEFSRDILPTIFKHSNFSSFVRQLNTYGFRKITTSRWEFHNSMFQRGEKELLCNIRRRKAWDSKPRHSAPPIESGIREGDDDRGSSSTSSSSSYTSLLDENKRLRRENAVLHTELVSMKTKLNELVDLASVYMEKDQRPKLFGVRLEVPGEKRKRVADIHVLSSK